MTYQDFAPLIFIVVLLIGFRFLRQRMIGAAITVEELSAKMKNPEFSNLRLIDVRSEAEYVGQLSHIEGAVNIPVGNMAKEIEILAEATSVNKNTPVVTICRTHNRSPRAAKMLRDAGFTDVTVLKGGMMAWKGQNLPVVDQN